MATATAKKKPTRERILEAALALFAAQGYSGTSVGEIELAAGLVPRSGALYKHFASKQALIEAALAERVDSIENLAEQVDTVRLGDFRSELTLIARLGLASLDQQADLTRLVLKEGDRFPELAAGFHEAVIARGQGLALYWVEAYQQRAGVELDDPAAIAQVMTETLVGEHIHSIFFAGRPEDVGRERFIATWVDAFFGLVNSERNQQ